MCYNIVFVSQNLPYCHEINASMKVLFVSTTNPVVTKSVGILLVVSNSTIKTSTTIFIEDNTKWEAKLSLYYGTEFIIYSETIVLSELL